MYSMRMPYELYEDGIMPSTSTGNDMSLEMFPIEIEDANIMINEFDNQEIAIPSTSTGITHSASCKSLILEIEKNSLKFEKDNIEKVIKCCETAVNRWLSVLGAEKSPEKEYVREYEEGADTLHDLQCKKLEIENKQEEIKQLEILREKAKEAKKKVPLLRIYLPNKQHTVVQIQEGVTLRNVVNKALQRRQLILDECAAYIKHRITCFISWDAHISTLPCKEVYVETLDQIIVPVFFVHNLIRCHIALGFCNVCGKGMLSGLVCTACDRKFHLKCMRYAPRFCEHLKKRRAYYERLLANNPTTGIIRIRPKPPPTPSTYPNRRHRRSPNSVSTAIAVNQDVETGETKIVTTVAIIEQTPQETSRKRSLSSGEPEKMKKLQVSIEPRGDKCTEDDSSDTDSIFSYGSLRRCRIGAHELTYSEKDEIGRGAYGIVYKGEYHGPVAVKKLNIETPTESQVEMFRNEVKILCEAQHQHVLSFRGCVCEPYLAIITQLCEGSSLYDRLHVREDEIEVITIVIILKQTSEAMDYLHARNIHHRDLKSKNIFFYNGLHVKIGDFGLAVMKDRENKGMAKIMEEIEKDEEDERNEKDKEDERYEKDKEDENDATKKTGKKTKKKKTRKELLEELENQLAGSVCWMAPEVLRQKEDYPYSFQSDVYAFGIVMFELFARELPYGRDADKLFIVFNVGRGSLKPDITKMRSDTPKRLLKLYKRCIEFEREKRPLFPHILRQVYAVFKRTPKIRRTTSFPLKPYVLPDTYIERADDVQDFITSDASDYEDEDDDFDASIDANINLRNSVRIC